MRLEDLYHFENEDEQREQVRAHFDELCNMYRAMLKANEGKSDKERMDAINRFRAGYFD